MVINKIAEKISSWISPPRGVHWCI